MSLQRITALLRKEFGQLFKDKRLLPIVFLAPVLQLTFLGFAASLDVKNISMVICDLDKTVESRSFIQSFSNSGYFTIQYATEDYKSVQGYVDNNKVNMALVIPPRFGDKVLSGVPAKVQILLDGSEGSTAAITMSYVNQIIMRSSTAILTEMLGGRSPSGGVDAEIRSWYNPSLKSRNFMVPGVLVLILLITTMNLTAMAIVKEREVGTLEQTVEVSGTAPDPWQAYSVHAHRIGECFGRAFRDGVRFRHSGEGKCDLALRSEWSIPAQHARHRALCFHNFPYPTASDDDSGVLHYDADDVYFRIRVSD